jgi:hypothetical protein
MKAMWLILCMLLVAAAASAHVNDRGMDYEKYKNRLGQSCCDDRDCKPADDFALTVLDDQDVVRLLIDGNWFTVSRTWVVDDSASDGRAHFCGQLKATGNPAVVKPEPVCVILPPHDT